MARAAIVALAMSVVAAVLSARPVAAASDPCPCGLLPATAVPGTLDAADSQAQQQGIELGVRFTSEVPGFVSGIRFYKGSGNTGTHLGDLWDAAGSRVSNASGQAYAFGGETASGWQTLTFRVPIPIAANTTYVAGYHTDAGSYASDEGFFDQPLNAPPLHSSNGGGVFAYGGVQLPTTTYDRTNYWVDVVFDTHLTPLVIGAQTSSSGDVQVTFDEPVVPSSVQMQLLRDSDRSLAAGTVTYQQLMQGPSAVLRPSGALAPGETYTVTVSGATDADGFAMPPQSWSFTTSADCGCAPTTASQPVEPGGPGTPALLP